MDEVSDVEYKIGHYKYYEGHIVKLLTSRQSVQF